MKTWLIGTVAAVAGLTFVIVLGCASGVGDPSAGSGTGFSGVDTGFSDAPSSPGGISPPGTSDPADDMIELPDEETRSFFTAFQVDPVEEDSAGPKFVVAGDVDQDGFMDIVSAWNQSQPVQLHLQRRDADENISFRTVTLAGTSPTAVMAGIELGQIDDDGWLDVVVLVKATGGGGWCPGSPPTQVSRLEGEIVVLFSPGNAAEIPDGDAWELIQLVNPFVQDRWIHNHFPGNEIDEFEVLKNNPENGGFTSLAVGDIDGVPGDEIVVGLNPAICETLGQDPPTNTVDLWINPSGVAARDPLAWGVPSELGLSSGVPISIMSDAPQVTDVAISDIDGDGDNDILACWDEAITRNVRWVRNPLVPHTAGGPSGFAAVVDGGSTGGADTCVGGVADGNVCGSDADCVGTADGACTGGVCVGGVANGGACSSASDCLGIPDGVCTANSWRYFADNWERRPVGQVDTNANVFAIGDIDNDGFDDVLVRSTAGEVVQWFRKPGDIVIEPEFPPPDTTPDRANFPWPVFTLAEFDGQVPEGIAIGDITGDGLNEVLIGAEGGVFWFDGQVGMSVFEEWTGNVIIPDDEEAESETEVNGVNIELTDIDNSTIINALLVVDVDGDGRNDVLGTLDRRLGSGLSNDRLVWYRNIRAADDAE